MRGGVVPPALLFLALGLALAFSPRRGLGTKLACLPGYPGSGRVRARAQAWLEGVFLAFWVSVIVTAASVHLAFADLDRGLPLPCRSTLLSGERCGSPCQDLTRPAERLMRADSAPATWVVSRHASIPVKVISSG